MLVDRSGFTKRKHESVLETREGEVIGSLSIKLAHLKGESTAPIKTNLLRKGIEVSSTMRDNRP